MTSTNNYPLSVHYPPSNLLLLQRGEGALIAPLFPLQTLKCPSLVRRLVDGSSKAQSTELGRTLETPGGRNRDESLSPRQPLDNSLVQAPSPFLRAHRLFTAEFSALRFSKVSHKVRLCKAGSFTFPLPPRCPAPGHQNITSGFPKPSYTGETTEHGVRKSSSAALWLWQSGGPPVSSSIKQEHNNPQLHRIVFRCEMKP